ncbi:MAG: Cell wall-associated glycosyl hydrolase [Thermoleophilia bacterium]|nr:Cell wall-associated glycosyl hydrolase [Thermoleophilia bacterium]
MRQATSRGVLLVAAALAVLAGPVTGAGAAASLPPQLVARLQADRTAADADLRAARTSLASAARTQRIAQAAVGTVQARRDLAASFSGILDMPVPPKLDARIGAAEQQAATSLERIDAKLEDLTEEAADAQAVALDADRRIRALQRASATEDERDASVGSWRFGSGGPAVSARSLDDYLESKGSPMAGSGEDFVKAGVEFEIDPRLVVAIAGAESYFGIETCAPFNAWGWGCPNGPARFTSWGHGFRTVTKGLRENYVDSGLTSVGELHLRYAPPNAENDPTNLNYAWPNNVAKFLVEQGGDPQDIEGLINTSR